MKVTFIMPSMGRSCRADRYVRTWQMEPLSLGVLSSLTPPDVDRELFDDRFEEPDYNTHTDLIAITVETYTARRSYEIAKHFRARGIPVIMGGFHPTLNPEEAMEHADSICIGEAEDLWPQILLDAGSGRLQKTYRSKARPALRGIFPDRGLFRGRPYLDIGLVETGRGCPFRCEFCTICEFYGRQYRHRPIEDVVAELARLSYPYYFFVDDNIAADPAHAKELFRALAPLRIRWLSQGSITMAADEEMLALMKKSGCLGVLIGLESLRRETLNSMHKGINARTDLDGAIRAIHRAGLRIYATFVFGYDNQDGGAFEETLQFAMRHRFFMAAFNHLVPFPGSQLYARLEASGLLLREKFWLDHDYTFGEVVFQPRNFTPAGLTELCFRYRKKFHSWGSIVKRLFTHLNWQGFIDPFGYLLVNCLSRIDVSKRQGLPMGRGEPL